MKNVFLVGDSIRVGFCETVKCELSDIAEVHYPDDNCAYTQYTYVNLPYWAGAKTDPKKVDLVYWNNGHHDTAHWMKDNDDGPLNSPEEYAHMLRRLVKRMHFVFPNAEIIFYTTTHREEGLKDMTEPRSNEEIDTYNAVAREVMVEAGIPVSDVCGYADLLTDDPKFADGIHFTPECFEKIGKFVACEIRERLVNR